MIGTQLCLLFTNSLPCFMGLRDLRKIFYVDDVLMTILCKYKYKWIWIWAREWETGLGQ